MHLTQMINFNFFLKPLESLFKKKPVVNHFDFIIEEWSDSWFDDYPYWKAIAVLSPVNENELIHEYEGNSIDLRDVWLNFCENPKVNGTQKIEVGNQSLQIQITETWRDWINKCLISSNVIDKKPKNRLDLYIQVEVGTSFQYIELDKQFVQWMKNKGKQTVQEHIACNTYVKGGNVIQNKKVLKVEITESNCMY